MRTIPFAGLCLISAMIALAQSPGRPEVLLHWPAVLADPADAAKPLALRDGEADPVQLTELKSMPSRAAAATLPPRPTWHGAARPVPCPFHTAPACAAWQNGR